MLMHSIQAGMSTVYKKETTVADAHSSSSSAGLDFLLSTPAVLKMVIDASANMLDKLLPQEYVTAGKHLELEHEKPTLIGEKITITVKVDKVEDNRVFLNIIGEDDNGIFCTGNYERVILERSRLLDYAYKRANKQSL